MRKTQFYTFTLVAVIAAVAYLNIMKPLNDNPSPSEHNVSKLSKVVTKQVSNVQKTKSEDEIIKQELTPKTSVEKAVTTPPQDRLPVDKKGSQPLEAQSTSKLKQEAVVVQDAVTTESKPEAQPIQADPASTTRVLLTPDRETTLASTIAGRIIRLKGSLGQSFRAGAVLVSFDCKQARARVEIAKAELAGAIEQHEAKVKMQGLDQASNVEVALAASASNKAQAELKLNKTMVSECEIYAPWKGRIAKAHVRKNMTVAAGEPLLDIVNTGPLKLKLNIPSKLLSEIKVGVKFNVIIDETGKTYSAKVKAINSRIDPVSQTVEVEAKMNKVHSELLAGMSGTADFTGLKIYP